MPVKSGYQYTIEHLLDNGATETIIPSVENGIMVFSTHSFSPFGIAGSRQLVGPDAGNDTDDTDAVTPAPASSDSQSSDSGKNNTVSMNDSSDSNNGSSSDQNDNSTENKAVKNNNTVNTGMAYDMDIILGGEMGGYLSDYMIPLGEKVMSIMDLIMNLRYLKNCDWRYHSSLCRN